MRIAVSVRTDMLNFCEYQLPKDDQSICFVMLSDGRVTTNYALDSLLLCLRIPKQSLSNTAKQGGSAKVSSVLTASPS